MISSKMGLLKIGLEKLRPGKKGWLNQEWSFDAESELLAPPLVFSKGKATYIAFGTKRGMFYLLNGHKRVIWSYKASARLNETQKLFIDSDFSNCIASAPMLLQNEEGGPLLVFGTENSCLYALDMKGRLEWKFNAEGPIRAQATAFDINRDSRKEIIFGSKCGKLYILNSSGKLISLFKARSGIEGSPFCYSKNGKASIIFGSNDGTLYSVDEDCQKRWEFRSGGKITAKPVLADLKTGGASMLLIGSADGNLYALDEEGGLKWNFQAEGGINSNAVVSDVNADGRQEILFGCSDDRLYCLAPNGAKIWHFEADFWIVSPPVVADINNDGMPEIITGSLDSSLYVLGGEGNFNLDYMPGIAAISGQNGHFEEGVSRPVVDYTAKMLFEIKAGGMILGVAHMKEKAGDAIYLGTKKGSIEKLSVSCR